MDMTSQLILGFGRTLKAVRTRKNLSQKELAEAVGVGIAMVKRYEQENLNLIGPNGFTLQMLTKLATFMDVHPVCLMQEVVSYTDIPAYEETQALDLLNVTSEETRETLLKADRQSEEPFNNDLKWCLDMAARLSELPGDIKAEIGQKVLQSQRSLGLGNKKEITKDLQDLFRYSIS